MEMHCPNTYNNINYMRKSHTLQPIRRTGPNEILYIKEKMLFSYLESQKLLMNNLDPNKANYANVPLPEDNLSFGHPGNKRNHSRTQHTHSRSQSQHYYYTMRQACDFNTGYYNIGSHKPMSNVNVPVSRIPSPVNDCRTALMHNQVAHLDSITVNNVVNELGGNVDSPPPMPGHRMYSILKSRNHGLYKIPFPQSRIVVRLFTDPLTGITLQPGSPVNVEGPSKDDRSKVTICFQETGCSEVIRIDVPHQMTQLHQPQSLLWS